MLNWVVGIRTVWLDWIDWYKNVFDNQTVLKFKLRAYVKLNCLKLNCFDIETVLTLIELLYIELFWLLTVCKQNLYWIRWIRTVLINWIVWNRNVFDNKTVYSC